jgi:hypothetical protein
LDKHRTCIWCNPEAEANPTKPTFDASPESKLRVTWSDATKPSISQDSKMDLEDFVLGMELAYQHGIDKSIAVVHKGASSSGPSHTVLCKDGSRLIVHDSNLQLLKQPDIVHIPKSPIYYRIKAGTCLTSEESNPW